MALNNSSWLPKISPNPNFLGVGYGAQLVDGEQEE